MGFNQNQCKAICDQIKVRKKISENSKKKFSLSDFMERLEWDGKKKKKNF
jgi:hypothetical protein